MMKNRYLLLPLFIGITGCTTAFEIGEGLNRLTTGAASNPKYLWDVVPASAVSEASSVKLASAPAATAAPEINPAMDIK